MHWDTDVLVGIVPGHRKKTMVNNSNNTFICISIAITILLFYNCFFTITAEILARSLVNFYCQ